VVVGVSCRRLETFHALLPFVFDFGFAEQKSGFIGGPAEEFELLSGLLPVCEISFVVATETLNFTPYLGYTIMGILVS